MTRAGKQYTGESTRPDFGHLLVKESLFRYFLMKAEVSSNKPLNLESKHRLRTQNDAWFFAA